MSVAPDWFHVDGMLEGVIMVTTDMSLSLLSVLLNLMVLNALREKETLLNKTHNLVLANICCANLVRNTYFSDYSGSFLWSPCSYN